MSAKKKLLLTKLSKGALYVITSPRKDLDYLTQVKEAVLGGIDILQFRDKILSDNEFRKIALEIRKILDKHNIPMVINDRLEIGIEIGAAGVHIGDNEIEFEYAKRMTRKYELALGLSSHFVQDALRKSRFADYLGFGPIFDTPNKKNHRLLGLENIKKVKKILKKPFVAIGGINESNILSVLSSGAKNVAVIRAVCGSEDIKKSAMELKKIMIGIR